ncbi:MAG: LacI family DNA-binding transcriptional regulator [Planctomycetota bacterium]
MTQRSATQADLAQELGIAKETVSRALNNHPRVSVRLRERVLQAADRLNYRPNAAALAMKNQRFQQIGVVIPDDTQRPRLRFPSYRMELLAGVNVTLEKSGYSMTLAHAGSKSGQIGAFNRLLRERAVDGVLVVGSLPDNIRDRVESLTDRTVFVETDNWAKHGCFRRNEVDAGRKAAQSAIAQGYRRIVWFKGSREEDRLLHFSESGRWEGLSKAAAKAGIPIEKFGPMSWELPAKEEREFIESLDRETAVVCYDVAFARWFAACCLRHGGRPGIDFGLACCDDLRELDHMWRELSRVSFDRYALGCQGAQALLDWIEGGRIPKSQKVTGRWIAGTLLPAVA